MNVKPPKKTLPVLDQGPDEKILDMALRPTSFTEYVGQENIKKNLQILVQATKKRKDQLEHILIHGPSGLGKTTLAYLIAKEFGTGIRITSGSALQKAGDIGSILSGLSEGDFLFIDEVHRLNKSIEETLYPAMENYNLDIIIGKGTSAKTLQIKLPRFTLIAATTRISLLSNPFRSRFGVQHRLDFYNPQEIEKILLHSAKTLQVKAEPAAIAIIARASRFTPRIANRLLKRVRDYAQYADSNIVTADIANKALRLLEIDELGLEFTDRKILSTIAEKFKGGPVGLKSVAAAIAEEEETIEDVYEPYLMRIGFLVRTSRGRTVSDAALAHLGITDPLKPKLL